MADLATQADARLLEVLPEGALFAVGGRVRDEVRANLDGVVRLHKDLDYVVVGLEFNDLVERLSTVGPANVVGASFAVVKLDLGESVVDVALPRRERSIGGGHRDFAVESGPHIPLDDDLGRRDFRMNMLARALPSGGLVDPHGGYADIVARRIDVLRDAAFIEDPLRMLRAVQFAARFGFSISDRTVAAMSEAAALVGSVSAERVRDELLKLLSAAEPSVGFELMRRCEFLEPLLPELIEGVGVEQNEFHAYDVYRHSLATLDAAPTDDALLRLAALLHDVGKPRTKEGPHFYRHEHIGAEMTEAALTRLRFPRDTTETVAKLVRNHMYATGAELTDAAVRRFIRRVGADDLSRQFGLRHADILGSGLPKRSDENERFEARVRQALAASPILGVEALTIDGRDVAALAIQCGRLPRGSRGGPIVGRVLRELLEHVTDVPSDNTREALLRLAVGILSAETEPVQDENRDVDH
ncbi:MAG: HD domain-containing protein [Candidatus Eremiobacteraeota bacterium]|nr:HD domain-containing protein [Candidatus Eremiobacteraeota bacterium]